MILSGSSRCSVSQQQQMRTTTTTHFIVAAVLTSVFILLSLANPTLAEASFAYDSDIPTTVSKCVSSYFGLPYSQLIFIPLAEVMECFRTTKMNATTAFNIVKYAQFAYELHSPRQYSGPPLHQRFEMLLGQLFDPTFLASTKNITGGKPSVAIASKAAFSAAAKSISEFDFHLLVTNAFNSARDYHFGYYMDNILGSCYIARPVVMSSRWNSTSQKQELYVSGVSGSVSYMQQFFSEQSTVRPIPSYINGAYNFNAMLQSLEEAASKQLTIVSINGLDPIAQYMNQLWRVTSNMYDNQSAFNDLLTYNLSPNILSMPLPYASISTKSKWANSAPNISFFQNKYGYQWNTSLPPLTVSQLYYERYVLSDGTLLVVPLLVDFRDTLYPSSDCVVQNVSATRESPLRRGVRRAEERGEERYRSRRRGGVADIGAAQRDDKIDPHSRAAAAMKIRQELQQQRRSRRMDPYNYSTDETPAMARHEVYYSSIATSYYFPPGGSAANDSNSTSLLYLRLYAFEAGSAYDTQDSITGAIQALLDASSGGGGGGDDGPDENLIIDVRGNGGGYLFATQWLLGLLDFEVFQDPYTAVNVTLPDGSYYTDYYADTGGVFRNSSMALYSLNMSSKISYNRSVFPNPYLNTSVYNYVIGPTFYNGQLSGLYNMTEYPLNDSAINATLTPDVWFYNSLGPLGRDYNVTKFTIPYFFDDPFSSGGTSSSSSGGQRRRRGWRNITLITDGQCGSACCLFETRLSEHLPRDYYTYRSVGFGGVAGANDSSSSSTKMQTSQFCGGSVVSMYCTFWSYADQPMNETTYLFPGRYELFLMGSAAFYPMDVRFNELHYLSNPDSWVPRQYISHTVDAQVYEWEVTMERVVEVVFGGTVSFNTTIHRGGSGSGSGSASSSNAASSGNSNTDSSSSSGSGSQGSSNSTHSCDISHGVRCIDGSCKAYAWECPCAYYTTIHNISTSITGDTFNAVSNTIEPSASSSTASGSDHFITLRGYGEISFPCGDDEVNYAAALSYYWFVSRVSVCADPPACSNTNSNASLFEFVSSASTMRLPTSWFNESLTYTFTLVASAVQYMDIGDLEEVRSMLLHGGGSSLLPPFLGAQQLANISVVPLLPRVSLQAAVGASTLRVGLKQNITMQTTSVGGDVTRSYAWVFNWSCNAVTDETTTTTTRCPAFVQATASSAILVPQTSGTFLITYSYRVSSRTGRGTTTNGSDAITVIVASEDTTPQVRLLITTPPSLPLATTSSSPVPLFTWGAMVEVIAVFAPPTSSLSPSSYRYSWFYNNQSLAYIAIYPDVRIGMTRFMINTSQLMTAGSINKSSTAANGFGLPVNEIRVKVEAVNNSSNSNSNSSSSYGESTVRLAVLPPQWWRGNNTTLTVTASSVGSLPVAQRDVLQVELRFGDDALLPVLLTSGVVSPQWDVGVVVDSSTAGSIDYQWERSVSPISQTIIVSNGNITTTTTIVVTIVAPLTMATLAQQGTWFAMRVVIAGNVVGTVMATASLLIALPVSSSSLSAYSAVLTDQLATVPDSSSAVRALQDLRTMMSFALQGGNNNNVSLATSIALSMLEKAVLRNDLSTNFSADFSGSQQRDLLSGVLEARRQVLAAAAATRRRRRLRENGYIVSASLTNYMIADMLRSSLASSFSRSAIGRVDGVASLLLDALNVLSPYQQGELAPSLAAYLLSDPLLPTQQSVMFTPSSLSTSSSSVSMVVSGVKAPLPYFAGTTLHSNLSNSDGNMETVQITLPTRGFPTANISSSLLLPPVVAVSVVTFADTPFPLVAMFPLNTFYEYAVPGLPVVSLELTTDNGNTVVPIDGLVNDSITLTFVGGVASTSTSGRYRCGYWNASSYSWESRGLQTTSSGVDNTGLTSVTCKSSHLTMFGVVTGPSTTPSPAPVPSNNSSLGLIIGVCVGFGCVVIVVLVIVAYRNRKRTSRRQAAQGGDDDTGVNDDRRCYRQSDDVVMDAHQV